MKTLKTLTIAGFAAAATLATALPAQAATTVGDEVSTRISVADIQTEKGLMKTYKRLQKAAEKECTTRITGSRLPRVDETCAANLLDDFIQDSGVKALATIHQEKTAG